MVSQNKNIYDVNIYIYIHTKFLNSFRNNTIEIKSNKNKTFSYKKV